MSVADGEKEELEVTELQRFLATGDSYFIEIIGAVKEHSKWVVTTKERVLLAVLTRRTCLSSPTACLWWLCQS